MSAHDARPGGRLPLFDPQELTPAQKALYNSINEHAVPWAESAGFKAKRPDGRLLGPFNPILLSPEIATSFLALQAAEQQHTTLNDRVRQVVILTVGAVWGADYERYAHAAVAQNAGLSEQAIRALCGGQDPAPTLTDHEQLAQRFTWRLTAKHHIDDGLYAQAVAAFGERGIMDLLFLAGCYDTVSSLLNAFNIPVPE